ncbi:MAG: OB-fold domain-containing protein [Candidatus Micrarchaeota archaeon]|nr:OB-fold domain-containing protein [Candidatus Micrarchaeota archaeon]
MAIIELEEGPRLTAQVEDCDARDVKIGTPVEMIFRKIQEDGKEGLIHYGFKFKVVR